jgi:hypothetical protein
MSGTCSTNLRSEEGLQGFSRKSLEGIKMEVWKSGRVFSGTRPVVCSCETLGFTEW